MTLTGHPLNDIHPLATNQPLINSKIELIWVSDTLPMVITYDQEYVIFNLLCRNSYEVDGFDSQSRNHVLSVLAD